MNKEQMLKVCDAVIDMVSKTKSFIEKDDFLAAYNLFSSTFYSMGTGQLSDSLRVYTQPSCKHPNSHIETDGKTVWAKCPDCHKSTPKVIE